MKISSSNILATIAIFVSIISLFIAIKSYQSTEKFQDYEFAPRLQILDEQAIEGSPLMKDRPALSYQAKIQNRGMKSVKLDRVYIDYGDESDPSKRIKYVVEGEVFLSPGQIHELKKDITWADVEEMKKRFNINQCIFFLRVAYHSPDGQIRDTTRPLCGFLNDNDRISYVHRGDCLP
jgi:hypothetical protein